MRILALVKQVPKFEAMRLGDDGRLEREGLELEMNPYCRRAVAKGVELARVHGGTCTVATLGPPAAEDVLREAIAWGADAGLLVTDPAFAGSDTLATARALESLVRREGPFDLLLAGRNSVDADTGQVAPELAELLGLPFLAGVKALEVDGGAVRVRCEHDDGWLDAEVDLPALLSVAERLCDPAKVPPEGRAAVDGSCIRRLNAADLGAGPWGAAASPTVVGEVRLVEVARARRVVDDLEEQVDELLAAVEAVTSDAGAVIPTGQVSDGWERGDRAVAVVVEPDRVPATRELLGAASTLARQLGGRVVAIGAVPLPPTGPLSSWGADEVVAIEGVSIEEDVATAVATWAAEASPWAVLAPGTVWGREVTSRVAARLGAGLTGDAVELEVRDDRLVAWKPAFGGGLVAAITASSRVQLVTVRPGVLPLPVARGTGGVERSTVAGEPRSRVRVVGRGRDDELEELARADIVVGVGTGVKPEQYAELQPLLDALGAELGATRKVTDRGWLPRARQIGITGRSIAPRLFVSIGASGKFNHMVGVRAARTVIAINTDRSAPVFGFADVGLVADWRDVVPRVVAALGRG